MVAQNYTAEDFELYTSSLVYPTHSFDVPFMLNSTDISEEFWTPPLEKSWYRCLQAVWNAEHLRDFDLYIPSHGDVEIDLVTEELFTYVICVLSKLTQYMGLYFDLCCIVWPSFLMSKWEAGFYFLDAYEI
jgi:hypothetical protein